MTNQRLRSCPACHHSVLHPIKAAVINHKVFPRIPSDPALRPSVYHRCNRRNSTTGIKTDSADSSLSACLRPFLVTDIFPGDLCCGEIERNERVTIYSGVTRLDSVSRGSGDATLCLTSDQGPHPALPHNMIIIITDKFYREYREYSDHRTRGI